MNSRTHPRSSRWQTSHSGDGIVVILMFYPIGEDYMTVSQHLSRLVFALGIVAVSPVVLANDPIIEVAKTPTCGCCSAWVDHLEASGFEVAAHDVSHRQLNAIKVNLDIAPGQASCHTAMVGGYFIEGHVHAREIRSLLANQPEAAGLTVPGMPVGSPGMEVDDRRDAYATLRVNEDGSADIYREHPARE